MADAIVTPQRGWPRWANILVLLLGVPTGLLLTAVALFGAVGDAGAYLTAGCQFVGVCAKAKPTPPTIPNYFTDWVDGGHNAGQYCEPQKKHWEAVYPDFNISWSALGEQRDKDWRGHATYKYGCGFTATVK